jgi:hypothetical protein
LYRDLCRRYATLATLWRDVGAAELEECKAEAARMKLDYEVGGGGC